MRKKITTYIEEGNIKKLKQIALDNNCSMADIIDKLIEKFLKGGIDMNNIIGKKWGEIEKEQKEKLIRCARGVNGVGGTDAHAGDCIVDFEGFEFSISGKVLNDEIVIDDNAVFYNPCD